MKWTIFVGTYTQNSESKGIYTLLMNINTGELTITAENHAGINPSFITCNEKYLFAANELEECGRVSSYKIHPDSYALDPIIHIDVIGNSTCYVALSKNSSFVYAANYGSGNFFGCEISIDGTLNPPLVEIQNKGKGKHLIRQEGPHAHSVNIDPLGERLIAADLGTDQLLIYSIDQINGSLTPAAAQPIVTVPSGEGPRHLVFHPTAPYMYLACELGNNIIHYTCSDDVFIQNNLYPTTPIDPLIASLVADIHISLDGRFLYVSNRGYDTIAAFGISQQDGSLTFLEFTPCGGQTPRNFSLSPDGLYLLVANQDSNNIVVFKRDNNTGRIGEVVFNLKIPKPVCISFMPK